MRRLPSKSFWLRAGLVIGVGALLLSAAACVVPEPRRGECSGKLCVEWNDQPDRDWRRLQAVVDRGMQEIGFKVDGVAQIVFIPRTPMMVGERAGFYDHEGDVVYIYYFDDLRFAPIAHELLHRALFFESGDPDPKHRDRRWRLFCFGGDVPCNNASIP